MDKLQDFKKGKIMDASKMYRFQCDCLTAHDAMDVSVDACGKDEEEKYITLCLDIRAASFWRRVVYAWKILRGGWCWREFCIRQDDMADLAAIIDPSRNYLELP